MFKRCLVVQIANGARDTNNFRSRLFPTNFQSSRAAPETRGRRRPEKKDGKEHKSKKVSTGGENRRDKRVSKRKKMLARLKWYGRRKILIREHFFRTLHFSCHYRNLLQFACDHHSSHVSCFRFVPRMVLQVWINMRISSVPFLKIIFNYF